MYVARRSPSSPSAHELHRAIYLMQRTLQEFVTKVANKWNFDASKVSRTVRVVRRGVEVEVDDDMIRELPEGQDMTLEIVELNPAMKREWEMSIDAPGEQEMVSPTTTTQRTFELRIAF